MIIATTPAINLDKVALNVVDPLPLIKKSNQYILSVQCQLLKYIIAVSL